MTDTMMSPDELAAIAAVRFGNRWPSKLATHMSVSRAAVSRWKKEGVASPDRAAQIRAAIEREDQPTKIRVPSKEEFATWRSENFGTPHSAARALGLDVGTILALESGVTRKGNHFSIKPWVALMMAGTLKKASVTRRPSPLYREQRNRAKAALEDGATVIEAAKSAGVSVAYVEKLQRQGDLPRSARTPKTKFDPSPKNVDKKRVIERALAGEVYAAIARDYGVSRERIRRIASDACINRQSNKAKNSKA